MAQAIGETTGVDRDILHRKIALRLLPVLFAAYVVANLDRNNVGFAKLGFIPDLGFDESMFGLGAGLFYLGYLLFEIPSNLLIARIGARLTFLRIMMLWFVFSFGFAFMTQPWHYYALRFLLGAAEAGYFPGVLLYLTLWVPRARRARFTALFMCAIPVSGMIGGPIAGLVMYGADGYLGIAGWRWLFIIEAIPAAALALIVYHVLADSPAAARWLSAGERQALEADLLVQQPAVPVGHKHGTLGAFRDRRLYLFGVMAFALISGLNGLNLWGPTILKQSGIQSILHIGLIASLPQIVGIITQLSNAWHSDRSGERRMHVAIPALVAAAGWFLLPIAAGNSVLSLILLMMIAGGLFASTGPFWATPSQYIAGTSAAAGIALVTTIGGIGGFASPVIVGWLADTTGSLVAGHYFYGGVIVVGVVSLLLCTRNPASEMRAATR